MGRRQKRRESKRTGKAATAHLAQENGDAFQRSVLLNVRDGCAVLSPISLSAFNTPSEYGRTNVLPKNEHMSKTPQEAFSSDFAAVEGKHNINVSNNIADSVSSCTKDSSSSAAGQVDHAKAWSNAIFLSKNSIEETTHNNSTFSQGESSPSTSSHFVAANIGSNIRMKLEQELHGEEKRLQGEIICIKENDLEKLDERDLIGHRKVGQSFISDAGGIAGSSTGSSVSYGSQGSEWFTPLNTRRELGSLAADSRQCILKEKQKVEILSTKKTLFDMHQESDGYENITPINDKKMELVATVHCLSGSLSNKVKEKERVGNQEAQDFPFDTEHVNLQEIHQERSCKDQANETVLHFKSEGCGALHSPLAGSQKDLCVIKLEAQLEDEIYCGLEEEITKKISHLSKKLEDLQSRQKSRCSNQFHLINELSSKVSPMIVKTLSNDKILKPVIESSPSMGKRQKSRVVSAKFLDWQRRSPASLGSKSAKKKADDSKLVIAGKIMTPPCLNKPYGGAREIVPAVKRRSVVSSAVASNNGNLTKNVSSEKRIVCLRGQEAVKEKSFKSNGQQGASKFKLGTCAGISEKQHVGEDLPSASMDQNCSMSPAFMLNDYSKRFDWVKTLRSGEIGAHGVPSKGKTGNVPTKCAAASIGCNKYALQSIYTEAPQVVRPGPEVKEKVSKRGTKGKELVSRVSSHATATTLHVKSSNPSTKATVLQAVTRYKVENKGGSDHQNIPKHKHQIGISSTTVKHAKIGTIVKPCTQKSCTKPSKSLKPMKDSMQQPMRHSTSCLATSKENISTPSTTKTQTKSIFRKSMKGQVAEVFTVEMDNGIQIQVEDRQELYIKEEFGPECPSGLLKKIQKQPNNDAAACPNAPCTPDNLSANTKLLS